MSCGTHADTASRAVRGGRDAGGPAADSLAVCEAEGEAREVEVALLDDVREGDVLLVHADVGLVKL